MRMTGSSTKGGRSVWVEPLGDWGEGAVQLVEIPTDAEIHDNIVAYWVPKKPVQAGERFDFRYRVHWTRRGAVPAGNRRGSWRRGAAAAAGRR